MFCDTIFREYAAQREYKINIYFALLVIWEQIMFCIFKKTNHDLNRKQPNDMWYCNTKNNKLHISNNVHNANTCKTKYY